MKTAMPFVLQAVQSVVILVFGVLLFLTFDSMPEDRATSEELGKLKAQKVLLQSLTDNGVVWDFDEKTGRVSNLSIGPSKPNAPEKPKLR